MESQSEVQDSGINGPIAPADRLQDFSDVTPPAPRGVWDTLGTALHLGHEESTLPQVLAIAKAATNQLPQPIHLTEEQYKNSEYFRPNVKYPNGANLSQIKEGAIQNDHTQRTRLLLAQREPGPLTGAASFIGQFIGQLLDPATVIAAVGTEGLVDVAKGVGILSKVEGTTRAARALQGIGRGAIEGTTITAPGTLARHAADNEFGVKNTSLDVLEQLMGGAVFGGTLRGLGGVFRRIPSQANRAAITTAANQVMGDKAVDVEPFIDQGHNEEIAKLLPPEDTGSAFSNPAEGQFHISDIEKEALRRRDVQELSAATDNLTVRRLAQSKIGEEKTLRSTQSTRFMVKKLLKISRIAEAERSPVQIKFMKRNEKLNELQDTGVAISQEAPELQQNLIDTLKNSDEVDKINDRLETHKNHLNALENNLKEKDTVEEDKNILRRDIDMERHKIELGNNRKNILENKPSLPDKVLDSKVAMHDAQMRVHDARIKIDESNAVEDAIKSGPKPVTKESVSEKSNTINSAEGDDTFDPNVEARLKQQVEMTPETEEEAVRIALEDLGANPDDAEFKLVLTERGAENKVVSDTDDDLKSINECVRGEIK